MRSVIPAGGEGGSPIEVLVGRVGRAHGIKGDVVVDARTDEPDTRFGRGARFDTPRGPLTVTAARWQGSRLVVRFAEVADRTAAEALRGLELRVDVSPDERPADPEEYYDHQLVGLTARTPQGVVLGEVADILHLPAHEVLVLRGDDGELLVPFVAEWVPEVDLSAGTAVVVPREGLLDGGGGG